MFTPQFLQQVLTPLRFTAVDFDLLYYNSLM